MLRMAATACCLAFVQDAAPIEIHFVMWKPHQREAWSRVIEAFESAHPLIRVRVEEGPHSSSELHAMLVTKLRARDPQLDVFLIDVVWPSEFAAAGYLEPLDDLFSGDERRRFFPSPIEADTAPRGLNEDVIRLISAKKGEPEWLLEFRLKSYRHWLTMQEPTWSNVKYPKIDFQDIIY